MSSSEAGQTSAPVDHTGSSEAGHTSAHAGLSESSEVVSEAGHLRPDIPLVTTLKRLSELVSPETLEGLTVVGEDLIVHGRLEAVELHTQFEVRNGGDNLSIFRTMQTADGKTLAEGTLTLSKTPTTLHLPDDLGQPIGFAMPVREPLQSVYASTDIEMQRAALLSFAADQLRSDGLLDDGSDLRLSARFGPTVPVGDTLRTFASRRENAWLVIVLNNAQTPVLRLELRPATPTPTS